MRIAALTAVLLCAAATSAAHADGARESRYGPERDRASTPIDGRAPGYTGQTYSGRALGWSGKREIVAPEAQAASQVQPWWARSVPQAAPVQQQQPQQPVRAAYQPPQQQQQQPQPRALPQSIYDAPPPAAQPAAPVPVAYAAPVQPAPQFQPGQVGARTYSVGRQFGMAPDPIPAAGPPRMVLIAPPASAPEDQDKPRGDDGEWSAKPEKDGDQ